LAGVAAAGALAAGADIDLRGHMPLEQRPAKKPMSPPTTRSATAPSAFLQQQLVFPQGQQLFPSSFFSSFSMVISLR
jgi:hypothetical protein